STQSQREHETQPHGANPLRQAAPERLFVRQRLLHYCPPSDRCGLSPWSARRLLAPVVTTCASSPTLRGRRVDTSGDTATGRMNKAAACDRPLWEEVSYVSLF